eukprot:1187961-Prorocentrum_minimum.AAC.3
MQIRVLTPVEVDRVVEQCENSAVHRREAKPEAKLPADPADPSTIYHAAEAAGLFIPGDGKANWLTKKDDIGVTNHRYERLAPGTQLSSPQALGLRLVDYRPSHTARAA